MSYEQRLNALNTESRELRRLKLDLLIFKMSRGYTAIDNKIINFRTDSHTIEVILKFLSLIVKLMHERFLLLLVISTVGMPCLTQLYLYVLHHSALLNVCCVLVI